MKILTFIVNRANYGRLKGVLALLHNDPGIELVVACSGTAVETDYGNSFEVIEKDGITVEHCIKIEDGERSHQSMCRTTAKAIVKGSDLIARVCPDIVLIIGDRYETLGFAISASYMNIPIAHIQGGELSGSIDDKIRHAITKLSDYHFVATRRSERIILQMGEDERRVYLSGCPCGDRKDLTSEDAKKRVRELAGSYSFNSDYYIVVAYHPVTTDYKGTIADLDIIVESLRNCPASIVWIKPNSDANSQVIEDCLSDIGQSVSVITNLEPESYAELIANAQFVYGNSSSFVRDLSFVGVPVILIGNRQRMRECSSAVFQVPSGERDKARQLVTTLLQERALKPSRLYGQGDASVRIYNSLKEISPSCKGEFSLCE